MRRSLVSAGILLALSAVSAGAVVMARPPAEMLRRMSQNADTIVVADAVSARGVEVPDSSSFMPRPFAIWTETRVVVTDVWKGGTRPGDTLSVWTMGGAIPGHGGQWVEDQASLAVGERCVLFLYSWRGRLRVDAGEMGALPVRHGRVRGYVTEGEHTLDWLHGRVRDAKDRFSRAAERAAH